MTRTGKAYWRGVEDERKRIQEVFNSPRTLFPPAHVVAAPGTSPEIALLVGWRAAWSEAEQLLVREGRRKRG
jgi:hypothetical protein